MTGYSEQIIVDADVTEHGWEVIVRFDAESMEAGWSAAEDVPLGDDELRALAPQIGEAIVEALIADKTRAAGESR